MRTASAARYARALVAVAATRGRTEEAVRSLEAAARFFATEEGLATVAVLQSSRVPREERAGLLRDVAGALSLTDEVSAVVRDFAGARTLSALGAVAARARAFASRLAEHAEAELRTARPLSQDSIDRIREAAERLIGRPTKLSVVEDASLLGGVVLRAGNRIWDGSLAGRHARAAEALVRP
ncbi:MAG: F0F1 ATP synthase subunit delta [Planctomycetota bacterium]